MNYSNKINQIISEKQDKLISLSNRIWEFAETRFEEYKSADEICNTLTEEGFTVERGVGGIETAFIASFGSSKPVIGILGEFDALSGLSQQEGIANYEPLVEGGNGHGCGHNLLGTASVAAAITVKNIMIEQNISGTIRYYGCPGEEGGSGKTFMVREGLFDDVDTALTWHPHSFSSVFSFSSLANYQIFFSFKGTAAHAANSPHLGRSSLDAVELMNVGVNYLREHIIPDAKIHYAITNTGGSSPNVVQSDAEVLYLIRAPKNQELEEIYQRVVDIAKGAALMTGTKLTVTFNKACSNYIPNHTLGNVLQTHLEDFGLPQYSEEELHFANLISQQISANDKQSAAQEISKISNEHPNEILATLGDNPFFDTVMPFTTSRNLMLGSTDVGDVSWIVPTTQFFGSCFVAGTPLHTWQLVSQGKTSIAHKGMLQAAKVLAATALELFEKPELIQKAKVELQKQTNGEYKSPIPKDVQPSVLK